MSTARTLTALSLLAATAGLANPAQASGLDAPLVGSGQSGPTTADAAAIHWNPAALADLSRWETFGGAGLVMGRVGYQRERRGVYQTPDSLQYRTPLPPGYVDPQKRGWYPQVVATPVAPTGEMFVAGPVIPGQVAAGIGVYVPYAAALDFPQNGPQAFQLEKAFIVATQVTASVAYRVRPQLSLGAGLSYVGGVASLSRVQDFAALADFHRAFANPPIGQPNDFGPGAPSAVRELDVLARPMSLTNAFSHGISFNAGLLYRPTDALRIGLTYQHGAAMRYHGRFAIDMNDPFFTRDLRAQGLQFKPLVQGDATLAFRLPKRLTLGAAYRASERLQIDGFASYVFYSDVDAFRVTTTSPDLAQPKLGIGQSVQVALPRNWKDTVWVEGSVRYAFAPRFLMSATAGYQSPASPDATIDVGSPDGHRLIGGLGAAWQALGWLTVQADTRMQGILPRTVTTSAHDLGNGRYTMFVAYAGGHLKARF
jgi:long-chain fatty acid transport protein